MKGTIDVPDIDEADILEGLSAAGEPAAANPTRVSATTVQRRKTISTYIGKLQEDIRVLTGVQDSLTFVKAQLEKEKVDTLNFERISKLALACVQNMEDKEMIGSLLDKTFPEINGAVKGPHGSIEQPKTSAALNNGQNEFQKLLSGKGPEQSDLMDDGEDENEAEQSLVDIVKNGLDEPDLVMADSDNEDDSDIDIEIE